MSSQEFWKHEYIQANGIRIHYVTAGEGPLVLLLHGFPEFWYTWRHQIPVLAKHFKVVAPDLRGYGETDRPLNISDYQSKFLVSDAAELIKKLGYEKAHIVGHDWGGAVAWRTALAKPEVVDRLIVLNCPHPYKFAEVRSNPSQLLKSWYVFFFQIPYVPEFLFKSFSKDIVNRLFKNSVVRKDTFTDEDIDIYCKALEKPGVINAALNYYRAVIRENAKWGIKKIKAPTLLIWGEEDVALGKELTYNMEPLFDGPFRIQYIPQCSHWVNEEQPDLVNNLIIDFLS